MRDTSFHSPRRGITTVQWCLVEAQTRLIRDRNASLARWHDVAVHVKIIRVMEMIILESICLTINNDTKN